MSREHLAVPVPRRQAQGTLQLALELGLLDRRRKTVSKGGWVEIPVTSPLPGREVVLQEDPEFYETSPDLAALFGDEISAEERRLLPQGWSILGNVIAVKIDPRIDHLKGRIGDALLEIYPRCRSVLLDRGVAGPFREPERELIAGDLRTETVHREDGVVFKLDPMRVMFSPGNMRERMRMGRLGSGETVVDMFAGIGYFTLPMAVHSRPKRIFAIEINPVAYGYLVENLQLNGVDGIVVPLHGDCAALTPEGVADRVVMGYVGTTDRYLDAGIAALRTGGVLHYHQTVPEKLYPRKLEEDLAEAAERAGRSAQIERVDRVKKYSPGMLHAVIDARVD
ncbi:class I SAM-dependent methyltransferase [Candidatus Methanocrinis natronophilus]|uniref:tRNA(Phe) (4-demethylwyosine(37)-C(7)) aminocarboxypropyltransferase n=1 Tax=Candidatus Methanocrinis natronophilus TaxID=3033396 RepID=A0ABT5X655_9EURY|nr:class I SAM-dependent methyltransferase family protein [Candidatus Methanocrinis natronophilus]MDF0590067.1 class I SAM-dependent methyltransferase family protein [Candidatus Methanocrinis natronophilus]